MNRLHVLSTLVAFGLSLGVSSAADTSGAEPTKALRAGIIGLDTSHVIAFTKLLNDPNPQPGVAGVKVVAAFPAGSPDIASSRDRIEQFTKEIRGMNVEIVDSIDALLPKVDVVFLESVDGRPHLEQVRPVFAAHKPVFIDKPLAGSLVDAIVISELGAKSGTPWFSSSSLRFGPGVEKLKHDPKLGAVIGCDAWSPCHLEKTHPDLYWYGVHGCELLFTYMGTGCEQVSRVQTDGTDFVTGMWKDGRVGTFRGIRQGKEDYGAVVFGVKGNLPAVGYEGYKPLVEAIVEFFKTGKPPVSATETIEIMTFMEAADESKRQGGAPVRLDVVLRKARDTADAKLRDRS